jgi:hypothetical protein
MKGGWLKMIDRKREKELCKKEEKRGQEEGEF